MPYSKYKVVSVSEGALGTIILGASGLPLEKLEFELNKQAAEGWEMVFQVIEAKRFWLFWTRETVVLTFGR